MAYSEFTLSILREAFDIREKDVVLFNKKALAPMKPSIALLDDLANAAYMALGTEKARAAHLMVPVFKEFIKNQKYRCQYYMGYHFDIDKTRGLSGYCDFLFSPERAHDIQSVVFCVVEAKGRNLGESIAEAGAEMFAAQVFNTQRNNPTPIVYGCVTDGVAWQFLKLENNVLFKDVETYYADEMTVGHLLRVIENIMNPFCDKIAAIK